MPRYLSLLVIAGLGAEELFRRSAHDDSYGSITARRRRARVSKQPEAAPLIRKSGMEPPPRGMPSRR
jgi:hypothetical protein